MSRTEQKISRKSLEVQNLKSHKLSRENSKDSVMSSIFLERLSRFKNFIILGFIYLGYNIGLASSWTKMRYEVNCEKELKQSISF